MYIYTVYTYSLLVFLFLVFFLFVCFAVQITAWTWRATGAARYIPQRHDTSCMTPINDSDSFSSVRDTNGRTMWEITSNYSFVCSLIAAYNQILVLLPSRNRRLVSPVNSVSTAITSYLISMSNESEVHPPPPILPFCNSC